jgi:quercetin dioxygenase-like cupin family protein
VNQTVVFQDVREKVVFSSAGPHPQVLLESGKLKALVAGLEPGQKIPPHPEALAMYYFVEGTGWMIVDGERFPVAVGTTIFAAQGAARGMEADTRLVFLAARVDEG